jgi:hypothetical protein
MGGPAKTELEGWTEEAGMITFGLAIVAVFALLMTWVAAALFEEKNSGRAVALMFASGLICIGSAFFAGVNL